LARLTARGRKRIKSSNFAVPASKSSTGKAKYPIHDKAHARNALARVSQHGTKAEKALVRKKVRRKYPSLKGKSKTKKRS